MAESRSEHLTDKHEDVASSTQDVMAESRSEHLTDSHGDVASSTQDVMAESRSEHLTDSHGDVASSTQDVMAESRSEHLTDSHGDVASSTQDVMAGSRSEHVTNNHGDVASSTQDEHKMNRFGETFSEIVRADTFVDKTLLIFTFLNEEGINIIAPRRFGKSVNLDMIKCFFEIQCDEVTGKHIPREDERSNYKLFKGLYIMKPEYANIVKHNFGKFPVLKVNFFCCDRIANDGEAIDFLKKVIHNTFKQNQYLQNSERLSAEGRALCAMWCSDSYHSKVDKHDIKMGLRMLAQFLHIHFDSKILVLIEDYDSLIMKMVFNPAVTNIEFDKFMVFYYDVLSSALSKVVVWNKVITGISFIGNSQILALLHTKQCRKYLCACYGLYNDHFGFTFDEVMKLFEKFNLTQEQKHIARKMYGGYNGNSEMFHPYSIVKYLSSDKRDFECYWVNIDTVYSIKDAFKHEEYRERLCNFLNKERHIGMSDFALDASDMKSLATLSSEGVHPEFEQALVLLRDQGYLICKKHYTLAIPNEEVRKEFINQLAEFYIDQYKISDLKLHECTYSFRNLLNCVGKPAEEITVALHDFHKKQQDFVSDVMISNMGKVNQVILKEICFVPLFKSGFHVHCEEFYSLKTTAVFICNKNCRVILEIICAEEENCNCGFNFHSNEIVDDDDDNDDDDDDDDEHLGGCAGLKFMLINKVCNLHQNYLLISSSINAKTNGISMFVLFK